MITLMSRLQTLEQLRILDGGACQTTDAGHHEQGIRVKRLCDRIDRFNNADHALRRLNRRDNQRPRLNATELICLTIIFILVDVWYDNTMTIECHFASNSLANRDLSS